MTPEQITQLISVCVSLAVPIIGFITALVKLIRNKQWNILKSMLCDFMIKAEGMEGATGEEKKTAVLGWCKDFCKSQGISFDEDQVSRAIETLIDLSKKVNANPKAAQTGSGGTQNLTQG